MSLPSLTGTGELPPGVHEASLGDILDAFGSRVPQRRLLGMRLQRIFHLARATGHVARFVVFGSFVSDKTDPNDVDVFLLMDDGFDLSGISGEARILFDHSSAQGYFGASVFWLRRLAAYPNEDEMIAGWQVKRDGSQRGVVEVIGE